MTDRTNAERQRRYIARLKAHAAKAGVTNAPDHAALAEELVQAKARWRGNWKKLSRRHSGARCNTAGRSRSDGTTRKSADEKLITAIKSQAVGELEALVLPLDDEGKDRGRSIQAQG